jgi:hypothetical protein
VLRLFEFCASARSGNLYLDRRDVEISDEVSDPFVALRSQRPLASGSASYDELVIEQAREGVTDMRPADADRVEGLRYFAGPEPSVASAHPDQVSEHEYLRLDCREALDR